MSNKKRVEKMSVSKEETVTKTEAKRLRKKRRAA